MAIAIGSRPEPVWKVLAPCALFAGLLAGALGEEQPAAADLRLQLPPGRTLRYSWTFDSAGDCKGQELGKPLDLRLEKTAQMAVLLTGEAPKAGETGLAAVLRFENLALGEQRVIGDAVRSELKLSREGLLYTENNRVLVDSRNDVGLEKLTEYQRRLQALHKTAARLFFDPAGRQTRVEGDRLLLDSAHGGHAQSLFPVLPGAPTAVGASWDANFELFALADLELESPAVVRSRATFAKWDQRDGRPVALIDLLAAWESRPLQGRDPSGLTVSLTRLEGQGGGAYLFDPALGRFTEGTMTFRLSYRLEGRRGEDCTALDVKGRGRFAFRLLPEAQAPRAPPAKTAPDK